MTSYSIIASWTLVVAFHVSSMHNYTTNDEWHVASPLPKGCSHRVSNFHTPFRHDISSTHSLPDTDTNQISAKKCSRFRSYPWSKKISTEVRVLPKLTVDDKASSKTHLVRLMHNVVTSKFKIFSVAKARCWNTRLSPKTPKVFPVLSSSSKIQFLG